MTRRVRPGARLALGARLGLDIQNLRLEDADISFLVMPSVLAGIAIVVDLGGPIFIAIEPAVDHTALSCVECSTSACGPS